MRTLAAFVLVLPVFTLATAAVTPPAQQPSRPHLAGSWELNPEKSQSQQREGISRGYPGGMGRGPGGPGGRGFPGRGGGEPPSEEFPDLSRNGGDRGMRELLRPKQHLEIAQTDSSVSIKDDAGWERDLLPDGRKVREELSQGGPAEVESAWKGEKLVSHRKLDQGDEVKETFALDRKTGELVVELEVKSKRLPRAMAMKRVYDKTQ
ncbi:MAG TPA: hypothetical protein VGQ17_09470 [Gemmatimonadales bacterium]|jgi:hypothetical protein|nr:hypothetical protein [Gemmatimonadales bacterium]